MKVEISQLEKLVRKIAEHRGLDKELTNLLVADHIGAHKEGKHTHGVGKLLLLDDALEREIGSPEVVNRMGGLAVVDGNGTLGHRAAVMGISLACEAADKLGIGAVAITNFSRYGRLKPIAMMMADRGFSSIITNGGGPAAIAPTGSKTPVLGTNPICIGIPGSPHFVADLATSERPWGEIRESILSEKLLPIDVFLDANGIPTRNPQQVEAVVPFGGGKGFALATALELLTGALFSGKVGTEVNDQFDLGALIVAIKTDSSRSMGLVTQSVSNLTTQIADAEPANKGHESLRRQKPDIENVELSNEVLEQLVKMSEGVKVMSVSNRLMD